MNFPKVKFIDISLATEVDWLHGFLFQNKWGWGKYIIKKHPKIKQVFSLKNEQEQINFLKQYAVQFRKNDLKTIKKNKKRYKKEWEKIEKDFFELLSKIMEINWPKSRKTIKAMISLNPICPRFLNDWSFSIFYNYKKIPRAIEVIMHECCHFLYFEKWKKLYPKMDRKKFESPHIEWHLSEILAPVILNDARIQKLLKKEADFYKEYQNLIINKTKVPKYFSLLYEKYQDKQFDFASFLKMVYSKIKKNKHIFRHL